ncbi:hypothetical protein ANN_04782 [Periplaneta americana]|uniref:DUF4817 domain-containing protein n=1 Tax=Periplaneta americana TaxID=6978 RepID=A0ABQ8TBF5_PERAM|nr:hypothetical protein ANN_04782 [Periplaneta americana]
MRLVEMNNDRESKNNSARKAENPHDNVVYIASLTSNSSGSSSSGTAREAGNRKREAPISKCTTQAQATTYGTLLLVPSASPYETNHRSLPSKETLRGHSDSSFRGEGYIQCCVGVRLCDMHSNQELAEIHFMYGKADGNAVLTRRLYQERYPQRQCPDRKTFVSLHYRLCEYGKFNSPGLGRGRPRSTTPEVQEEILEAVNMTPISTRRVALQHVRAYETHVQLFHLITRCGSPSTCGPVPIIGDRLVGPHVHVNRLTGQAYTNFLENTIPHVLEDTPLINRQNFHFLHDGAPAHFSRTARRYLDRRFPDRWIGRGGPIAWPPCSPDLNPLDFYLWGHLKSLVYSSPVPDLESLRNRIVACSEDIRNTPGVWDRVRRSMRQRFLFEITQTDRHQTSLDVQAGSSDDGCDSGERNELRAVTNPDADYILMEFCKSVPKAINGRSLCDEVVTNSLRLRWAGHVARMSESRNAHRVLVGRPEGTRPLGRPRRRWKDNIKMDLREVEYDARNWNNLAQDFETQTHRKHNQKERKPETPVLKITYNRLELVNNKVPNFNTGKKYSIYSEVI